MKVKNDPRSEFSNLSNWKEEAWKNQGFNGIRTRDLRDTGAMLYQLSYEATHWERGQFVEFISSRQEWNDVSNGYIWNNSYIWTAVIDESEEWSSQWIFRFIVLSCCYNKAPSFRQFVFKLSAVLWEIRGKTLRETKNSNSFIDENSVTQDSWKSL